MERQLYLLNVFLCFLSSVVYVLTRLGLTIGIWFPAEKNVSFLFLSVQTSFGAHVAFYFVPSDLTPGIKQSGCELILCMVAAQCIWLKCNVCGASGTIAAFTKVHPFVMSIVV